jgi:hypothetical protein
VVVLWWWYKELAQSERVRQCQQQQRGSMLRLDGACRRRRRRALGVQRRLGYALQCAQPPLSVTQRELLASPSESSWRHPARALGATQRALKIIPGLTCSFSARRCEPARDEAVAAAGATRGLLNDTAGWDTASSIPLAATCCQPSPREWLRVHGVVP